MFAYEINSLFCLKLITLPFGEGSSHLSWSGKSTPSPHAHILVLKFHIIYMYVYNSNYFFLFSLIKT